MRLLPAVAGLLTLTLVACAGSSDDATAGDSALATSTPPESACSLTYWGWVLHDLEPKMERPIAEVSDESLQALVATHPASEDTDHSYSVCWNLIFDKHFVGDAIKRLHDANTAFVFQGSPDFKNYDRFRTSIAMTPELRRNAKALLALRPPKMMPNDEYTWATTYAMFLSEVIHPVAVPGPNMYEPGGPESEWQITDAESEYLAVIEKAQAAPTNDGVYREWVHSFSQWIFGPPPAVTRSFVFNLPFEAAAESDSYGLSGIVMQDGRPVMPPLVKSFVNRFEGTRPQALGDYDSSGWMSIYSGRAIRALGDLSQAQPMLSATDALALDVLEQVKPDTIRGAFTYGTWLDLVVLAKGFDASWTRRFLPLEPCLDAPDLAAAQQTYTEKAGTLPAGTVSRPHACAR